MAADDIKLTTDDLIHQYFYDNNYAIYYREMGEDSFHALTGFDEETIKDATCFGFEFIARKIA